MKRTPKAVEAWACVDAFGVFHPHMVHEDRLSALNDADWRNRDGSIYRVVPVRITPIKRKRGRK